MMQQLNKPKFPKAADIEAQIETRSYRRGVGNLFLTTAPGAKVKKLEPMPANPTFLDFFKLRMQQTSNHVLQSANRAMKTGQPEEIVMACLLHDTVHALIKTDHGYWGAQLYAPYVSERIAFAVRYHQALRHIQADYKMLKSHKWYSLPRMVTVNDLYAFEPGVVVTLDPFIDVIGRQFKNPKEGLGNDGSPVAHMWRAMVMPDNPL
jgi:hypothetical protein